MDQAARKGEREYTHQSARCASRRAADQGRVTERIRSRDSRSSDKAKIETFYWAIVEEISDYYANRPASTNPEEAIPEEISELIPHLGGSVSLQFFGVPESS